MGVILKQRKLFIAGVIFLLLSSTVFSLELLKTKIEIPFLKKKNIVVNHYFYSNKTYPNIVFFALHDDENTALQATKEVVSVQGGNIFEVNNQEKRLLKFNSTKRKYYADLNRIFTTRGIKDNIKYYNGKSSTWAYWRLKDLGHRILAQYPFREAWAVVGVHNNTNGKYSILSYKKGYRLGRNAKLAYINPNQDSDNFYLVTTLKFYNYFKGRGFNVVLQDNKKVVDDGSLSVYCAKYNLPYINVEAQFGNLETQKLMIQAIFDLYQQEHAAKKENKNEIKIYVSEKKMKVNINGFKKEYSVSTGALKGQKLFANDLRTPLGRYKVIKIQDSTKWKFKTTSGAYGPWFIRLKTAWSGIGIHGIHDENLIGDANSHGCIRLRNQDIHELVAHVYKGLEVVIFP